MTKPGLPNVTWYSILSYDHKPNDWIMRNMLRRFKEFPELTAITQVVKFYDNQTKQQLDSIDG